MLPVLTAATAAEAQKRNTYNKRSWNDNRKLHTLVFYILPFILINLVIFIVATSKPKIEYDVSDTRDYRSVDISIRIRSLLPIRETSVTMESQPLEMERKRDVYNCHPDQQRDPADICEGMERNVCQTV